MDLRTYLAEKRAVIDEALDRSLPAGSGAVSELIEAMRYSLFAGGKRLRPILCMTSARAVGGSEREVLPVACALEFIHTYSLIHDDLPVMDNDDLRRGKPTNHKVFGEATALLAGDALLTEAFRLMTSVETSSRIPAELVLRVTGLIAGAAGVEGMVGGQTVDVASEGKPVDRSTVEFIHTHKTAALITASLTAGALLGGGSTSRVEAVTRYGRNIGLAFQISDDILDIEGDTRAMGKPTGMDTKKGKNTFPGVVGLPQSKKIQQGLVDAAVEALGEFDGLADPLRQIARYIIERKK